jgi:hypothetical protein
MSLDDICSSHLQLLDDQEQLKKEIKLLRTKYSNLKMVIEKSKQRILEVMATKQIFRYNLPDALFSRIYKVPLDTIKIPVKVIIRSSRARSHIQTKLQEWNLENVDARVRELCIQESEVKPVDLSNPPIANVIHRLFIRRK